MNWNRVWRRESFLLGNKSQKKSVSVRILNLFDHPGKVIEIDLNPKIKIHLCLYIQKDLSIDWCLWCKLYHTCMYTAIHSRPSANFQRVTVSFHSWMFDRREWIFFFLCCLKSLESKSRAFIEVKFDSFRFIHFLSMQFCKIKKNCLLKSWTYTIWSL